MHAEGAERGWWLGEGHLVQRVHTEHTCRCSKPARLEAGRVASSSPTMACMRCLGSSKQQVCCQAIHAGVWSLQVPEVGSPRRLRAWRRPGRASCMWLTLLEGQL